jgi:hypothetical protein
MIGQTSRCDQRNRTSSSSGDYSFTLLPPGQYTIRGEAAGFPTFVATDMAIGTGDRARLDANSKAMSELRKQLRGLLAFTTVCSRRKHYGRMTLVRLSSILNGTR